jgi:NADPH:quinone reductase
MTAEPRPSLSWRVHRLGTPAEALRLEERPARDPGPGEVQVRVEAVGLNHPDLLLCAGRYQERPALPFSPGFEAAGTVVAAGPGVGLQEGRRVVVVPELPDGALQESLTVPVGQVYPLPDALPATTGAVLHIAYVTAHAALHHRAGLRPGETLLVSGAAGGVGSAAVQLGRLAGATVVALVTGEHKARAALALGADAALDLAAEPDVVARIRSLTGGRGADVVLDVVGGGLFDTLRRCVAFEGRLVAVGFAGGSLPVAPVNHLLLRNYAVIGLHLAAYRRQDPALLRRLHDEVVHLAGQGRIAPAVHGELPFDRAPEGLAMLADREVVGRVVLSRQPG